LNEKTKKNWIKKINLKGRGSRPLQQSVQKISHHASRIVSDHIPEYPGQQSGDDQPVPAFGGRHRRGGRRPPDGGVGRQEGFFQGKFQPFSRDKGHRHIDKNDDENKNHQEGRVFQQEGNGSRHADDDKEEINQKGADFLGPAQVSEKLPENGHGDDGHRR